MPLKYSPNWYWSALGCSVARHGFHRTITDNLGNVICENAGHEKECSIAQWLYFGAIN